MGFAMLVLALGGCSCGDTVARPSDAAGDAIRLDGARPDDAPDVDACPACDADRDAGDLGQVADADAEAGIADSTVPEADMTDADEPDASVSDLGVDLGVDSGCAEGLERCVDDDGTSRCVDVLTDNCHCGRCNNECVCILDGLCQDGPGEILCRPTWCTPDGPQPVLADPRFDHEHCGGCWQACAPDERCFEARCEPLSPDAGSDTD